MTNNIFITYSPTSQAEESTALRLQTISNLYGLDVVLPHRQRNNSIINSETQSRIINSTFVVAFCVDGLTKFVKSELDYAISNKKPIIVIYDKSKGKKINFDSKKNINEVFVDFNKTDEAFHNIAKFMRDKIQPKQAKQSSQKNNNNTEGGLEIALLAIGIGLLAAWVLSKNNGAK